MTVSNDFIDEVRNRNDIVAVLSEYINLKKAGKNFRALCPFHTEKTPSFTVSTQKQIFHCFGCQVGGNVFNFVMKIDNLSFMEAVEKLAKRVGLSLPQQTYSKVDFEKNKERENIFAANLLAAEFYEQCLQKLPEAKVAVSYLKKRGLTLEVQKKFKIGYAPQGGDSFLKLAKTQGLQLEVLQKAGLVNNNGGRYYDYFRQRITYPILDAKGRVVAFGARTLSENIGPKYLNTAETAIFSKSKILYGLNWANNSIRQKNEVMLLEGYMDVIACHQFDIENCVATMGVALTAEQIELIKRYSNKIVIIYDADQAGVTATLRGLDLLMDSGLEVRVATLEAAKDPDEFLHKNGKAALEKIVADSLNIVEYKMEQLIALSDLSQVQGKVFVVNELLPIVAKSKNIVEQKEQINKIAQRLELNEEALLLQLERIGSQGFHRALKQSITEQNNSDTGFKKAQSDLIQLFLNDSSIYGYWQEHITLEDILDEELKRILEAIIFLYQRQKNFTPSDVVDYLQDEGLSAKISQLALTQNKINNGQALAGELIKNIKLESHKERYKSLSQQVSGMLEKEEPIDAQLYQEYKDLTKMFKGSKG